MRRCATRPGAGNGSPGTEPRIRRRRLALVRSTVRARRPHRSTTPAPEIPSDCGDPLTPRPARPRRRDESRARRRAAAVVRHDHDVHRPDAPRASISLSAAASMSPGQQRSDALRRSRAARMNCRCRAAQRLGPGCSHSKRTPSHVQSPPGATAAGTPPETDRAHDRGRPRSAPRSSRAIDAARRPRGHRRRDSRPACRPCACRATAQVWHDDELPGVGAAAKRRACVVHEHVPTRLDDGRKPLPDVEQS